MKQSSIIISFIALFLWLGTTTILFLPDDAEAARMGGGSSMGSRGSRSMSPPRQATPRNDQATSRQAMAPQQSGGMMSRFGSGMMGGIAGLALGGLLGSMLFGGGSGGGGLGLLEILLIGGIIWFLWNRFKKPGATQEAIPAALSTTPYGKTSFDPGKGAAYSSYNQPQNFAGGATTPDEVSQGLARIMSMDANFNEMHFIAGAKGAYQQIQGAWSDWSVDRLRPLLTERMWSMIQNHAQERQVQGRRDIIEKIRFHTAEISEVWQEGGDDWITVHFVAEMVEYETDVGGRILKGDPNIAILAEEYWTFCRPVEAINPNWQLSAIQQPGEVARSIP